MASAVLDAKIQAEDLPLYVTYPTEYHWSDEWGERLVDNWIAARKAFVTEQFSVEEFQSRLRLGILSLVDVEEAFREACEAVGADPDNAEDGVFDDFENLVLAEVMNLVPSNLYAEFCWVPSWDGQDLDDLLGSLGIQSNRWRSTGLEDVLPGRWLEVFLKLVNCSSVDLVAAAIAERGDEGRLLAERVAAKNLVVHQDQNRKQLLSGSQVIAAIENGYFMAVPMAHCEVNVRALYGLNPTQAMRISSDKEGSVHVGFHEFINGGGYMDTYPGELIIPPGEIGFASSKRWHGYGINKTYGLFRPAFYTTPESVPG